MDIEILAEVIHNIEKQQNEKKLITKFNDLDMMLYGIENGSIITIGGRPSMGKTAFATTILLNLLSENKKCFYFSYEMSTNMLIRRLLCQYAEVDYLKVNIGHLNQQDWEKLAEGIYKFEKFNLKISDELETVDYIKEKVEKEKPEFVFIDYIQLIPYKSKRPKCEVMEDILKELKLIAKQNNCIIFLTSQLSRGLECRIDKRPMLSDLREAGAIEEISDVVMFVYREEYYTPHDELDRPKGETEIIVAKNKYGPTGTVNLLFRSEVIKFYNPVVCDVF